jgi:hypothetical protein
MGSRLAAGLSLGSRENGRESPKRLGETETWLHLVVNWPGELEEPKAPGSALGKELYALEGEARVSSWELESRVLAPTGV